MKKKFKTFIFALTAALFIPTSVFASGVSGVEPMGAGEWDTLLNQSYALTSASLKTTQMLYSGGGDVRYCVSGVNSGNTVDVKLWNSDPERVFVIAIMSVTGPQSGESCTGKIDVRPFVDGGEADLYLTMTTKANDTITLKFQD